MNFLHSEGMMNNLKIHRKIAEGYTEWLQSAEQDLSSSTVRSYVADLNQFFSKYNSFTRRNIENFKNDMQCKLAVVSLNRKFSSLKSYNRYLIHKGLVNEMLVKDSDQVDIQSIGNPTKVAKDDVVDFLQAVKKKPSRLKVRNIAMIYLMANTGLRREEVCNLKLDGLKRTNKGYILETYGKENKVREVGLNDLAVKVVENYLKVRNKSKYADSKYLFLSQRGEKLTVSAINDVFEFYGDINPHALRHNYATTMLEEEILTLPELKNQMGHKSINTTYLYTHARQDVILKKIKDSGIGEL